jgi:predicted RNA-binding protein with TRAM domain
VKLGEEYEVDVLIAAPNGEGIAKVKGYSIFIPKWKPGDHVRVKITRLDAACCGWSVVT